MSNMSYCRFENTRRDLKDCNEWLGENEPSQLSEGELKAFKRLVQLCHDIALDYSESILGIAVAEVDDCGVAIR
jgi:hypothetical protein